MTAERSQFAQGIYLVWTLFAANGWIVGVVAFRGVAANTMGSNVPDPGTGRVEFAVQVA